ncbi:MAG TPA: hypothetical protein VL688_03710 [Verrucomicrobiae bacterium]|jgi:hypothetical protein|nr:hypothetical protein [Verrucomicrobiae bacterium]
MKTKTLFLTVLLSSFLAVPAFANHGGGEFQGGGTPSLKEKFFEKYHFLMSHREDLKLSQDQISGLMDLKFAIKKDFAETEAQMEVATLNLFQELHKNDADLNKMNGFIDNKIEAKRRFDYDLAKSLIEMKKILSADQVKQMQDLWLKDEYAH